MFPQTQLTTSVSLKRGFQGLVSVVFYQGIALSFFLQSSHSANGETQNPDTLLCLLTEMF